MFCFFFFSLVAGGPGYLERFLLPWASVVTKPGDAGAALRCRHLASFEIAWFFAAVSEVSGVMGFPAGLAPAAL